MLMGKKAVLFLSVLLCLGLLVTSVGTALADDDREDGRRAGRRIQRIQVAATGGFTEYVLLDMKMLPGGRLLTHTKGYGGITGNLSGSAEADLRSLVKFGPGGDWYDFTEVVRITGTLTLDPCVLITDDGPLSGTLRGILVGTTTAYYTGDPQGGT